MRGYREKERSYQDVCDLLNDNILHQRPIVKYTVFMLVRGIKDRTVSTKYRDSSGVHTSATNKNKTLSLQVRELLDIYKKMDN